MGLPYKLAVVSATVLSTALMFNLSTPFITELAISDLATIWTTLISWLKPPYLYVVINCIIIIIVASSRLQSKIEGSYSVYTPLTEPVLLQTGSVKDVHPVQEIPPVHEPKIPLHNDIFVNEPVEITNPEFVPVPEQDFSTPYFSYEDMKIATKTYDEIKKSKVKKSVISMSTAWIPRKIDQVDLSFPVEKPPASARFGHRKPTKATSEAGGRTLKVTKPKRQDTLETTWKTITEGRSVPLTRHLRKSDTFETHGQGARDFNSNELSIENHPERMTKSDTFDVSPNKGGSRKPPPSQSKLSRAGGSGRLRKDPSLGQEELNRKVEAFIKKFNEDMRLQRQESMNQYMEMINRGAH